MATGGVTEPLALAALDELIACDLVRPATVPRRFHFRHPLVRNAVYASSSTSTRLTAHVRCAEALAAQGWPATARASHVEHSARRGDAAAVGVLLDAGRATAAQIPSVAARWFRSALRLLPENAAPDERVEVLTAAAAALATAGRLEEARSELLQALKLAADHDVRVRIIATCAGVEQQLGRQQEAHDRLLGGLEELTDRATEPGVSLMGRPGHRRLLPERLRIDAGMGRCGSGGRAGSGKPVADGSGRGRARAGLCLYRRGRRGRGPSRGRG
ncbi:MAG: hypothetical protein ABR540_08475 [Acidimicrobiales bacterium]